MNQAEKIAAAQRIHKKARYLRGRFLNNVAAIEHGIGLILTEYFCVTSDEEKKRMFYTDVVNGPFFPLRAKMDLLVKIVKKDYPFYWEREAEVLNRFDEIRRFRNKLAHSIVDVSDEALSRPIEEGIGFVEWKEGEPITDAQFDDLDIACNMISGCLADIKTLLPFRARRNE